ncbi:hypothetical protein DL98DRAFT_518302 [Cadophora sp. DSE1049]|nr:hypothetical protein DL98DRAFT_518302 [Cadophora sp. DSE1049]
MHRVHVHRLVTIGAEMVRTNMKIKVSSRSTKRAIHLTHAWQILRWTALCLTNRLDCAG